MSFSSLIDAISGFMYSYLLVFLLIAAGLLFSILTKGVQFRYLAESIRAVKEPKSGEDASSIAPFKALMVSTASRVGIGNIAGVSTAVCLGGAGAVFWMWLIALLGSASAFIESTLAQIYKKRDKDGSSFGGPAYYIEQGLKQRWLGMVFAVVLIATYMGGFNLLQSFNIASAFDAYSSNINAVHVIIGVMLALMTAMAILNGSDWLSTITGWLVPLMAILYIGVALIIMILHINLLPGVIGDIFAGAFDFPAIFAGFTGSAIMYGIKRGLFSNEAGVGSAPNAAAAASVSHPVKQGLVQMLSVYIDTILICTATAFMLLTSGVVPEAGLAGVPYVQAAVANTFTDTFSQVFVTVALFTFAFTSIIGNYFYAEANLKYLNQGSPGRIPLYIFRAAACVIVLIGATIEFGVAWNTADVLMGLMALINLPVIALLSKPALAALADYRAQRAAGQNPVFKAKDINLEVKTDFWTCRANSRGRAPLPAQRTVGQEEGPVPF
jgi:AGCS family alanine or glycine:cation symporter